MCTSTPAIGCALESLTIPWILAGPTGEAHAATAETIKMAKQIWSDLIIIEVIKIDEQMRLRKHCRTSGNAGSVCAERLKTSSAWPRLYPVSASPRRFLATSSAPAFRSASPWHHRSLPSTHPDDCQFAKGPKRNVCPW